MITGNVINLGGGEEDILGIKLKNTQLQYWEAENANPNANHVFNAEAEPFDIDLRLSGLEIRYTYIDPISANQVSSSTNGPQISFGQLFSGSSVRDVTLRISGFNKGGFYASFFAARKLRYVKIFNINDETTGIASNSENAFTKAFESSSIETFHAMITQLGAESMQYAFQCCERLRTVTIPKLTSIGGYSLYAAFLACKSLQTVTTGTITTTNNYGMYRTFYGTRSLQSVSFLSTLTSIAQSGMKECFYNSGIKNVTMNITSVTTEGLKGAFQNSDIEYLTFAKPATGLNSANLSDMLTGCNSLKKFECTINSVSSTTFNGVCKSLTDGGSEPILRINNLASLTVASFFANNVFKHIHLPHITNLASTVLTGVPSTTLVHFAYKNKNAIQALSGYATAFGIGASYQNNLVFDLLVTTVNLSEYTGSTIYIDGEAAVSDNTNKIDCDKAHEMCIVTQGVAPYGTSHAASNFIEGETYTPNLIPGTTNPHTISFTVTPADATITVKCGGYTLTPSNGVYTMEHGSVYSILINKAGYASYSSNGILTDNISPNIVLEEALDELITINSTNASTLVSSDSHFIVSGNYIINGSQSKNVNNGYSKKIFSFTSSADSDHLTMTVKAYVSSEANYDIGYVHIGTTAGGYSPTNAQARAGTAQSGGAYIFKQSGTSNSINTFTYTLQPDTTYYVTVGYTKDGSGNNGNDQIFIQEISYYQKL